MAKVPVEVEVKSTYDSSGGDAAERHVAKAKASTKTLLQTLNGVRETIGKVFNVLGMATFVIGGIMALVAAAKKLWEALDNVVHSAERLARTNLNASIVENFHRKLETAAKKAKELSDNFADALANLRLLSETKLENIRSGKAWNDAIADAEEQKRLSGVTDADERRRITDAYAKKRIDRDERYALEEQKAIRDAERKRADLEAEAAGNASAEADRIRRDREKTGSELEAIKYSSGGKSEEEQRKYLEQLKQLQTDFKALGEAAEAQEKIAKAHQRASEEAFAKAQEAQKRIDTIRVEAETKRTAQTNAERQREEDKRKATADYVRQQEAAARDENRRNRYDRQAAELDRNEQNELSKATSQQQRDEIKARYERSRIEAREQSAREAAADAAASYREQAAAETDPDKRAALEERANRAEQAAEADAIRAETDRARLDQETAERKRAAEIDSAANEAPEKMRDRIAQMGGFATAGARDAASASVRSAVNTRMTVESPELSKSSKLLGDILTEIKGRSTASRFQ